MPALTLTADPNAIVRVDPKDLKFNEKVFQKMPALTDEARDLLLTDIREKGVTVPVEITENGTVVDGHNRVKLAKEAGITDIPAIVKAFEDEAAATAHVFAVNLQRRHLNQTDKRKLVKEYLALDPYKSNRQVAEELGGAVTDKTVGAVRDEAEKEGTVEKSSTRKGKDGKTYSKSGTSKKQSKGAAERKRAEAEKTAVGHIRLGINEAARLIGKVEITSDMVMSVLANATKAKETLAENLAVVLPIFTEIAAHLGVPGYEWAEAEGDTAAEGEEAEQGTQEAPAESGDAPF